MRIICASFPRKQSTAIVKYNCRVAARRAYSSNTCLKFELGVKRSIISAQKKFKVLDLALFHSSML